MAQCLGVRVPVERALGSVGVIADMSGHLAACGRVVHDRQPTPSRTLRPIVWPKLWGHSGRIPARPDILSTRVCESPYDPAAGQYKRPYWAIAVAENDPSDTDIPSITEPSLCLSLPAVHEPLFVREFVRQSTEDRHIHRCHSGVRISTRV